MDDINRGNGDIGGIGINYGAPDDTKRTASAGYNVDERKHRALAGQWQTPPMPAYTSTPVQDRPRQQIRMQQQQVQPQLQPQLQQQVQPQLQQQLQPQLQQQVQPQLRPARTSSNDKSLPVSTPEEYALALQEAYEAGARMAQQQQQQQIPTAASCPDFSTGSSQQHHQQQHQQHQHIRSLATRNNSISTIDEMKTAIATPTPVFQLDHQIHPPHQRPINTAIPDPLSSSMPPPPPPSVAAAATTATAQQQHHAPQITYKPRPTADHQPFLQPHQSQQDQYQPVSIQHPTQVAVTPQPVAATSASVHYAPSAKMAATTTSKSSESLPQQQQQQPAGRSMSMPDMSTYAAEAEEEKRVKRLARNRASARLRRLRKKNLVDAYETEVGILEKTLKQLHAHGWGKDTDDHKPLLDALGMERGQQAISPEERTGIIRDILKQQRQQVNMLQQAQREQETLAMLASMRNFGGSEEDVMIRELQDILQLSDDQKTKLQESSEGLDKEVEALETVAASLEVMQRNDWLLNEGVQNITDQFTSILHKNQQSKLLLWTDANAEAVDQLDHVEVQPLQSAPMFSFGVESTTPGDEE